MTIRLLGLPREGNHDLLLDIGITYILTVISSLVGYFDCVVIHNSIVLTIVLKLSPRPYSFDNSLRS